MKVRIKKRTNELYALKPPGSKRKIYNVIKEEEDSQHVDAIRQLGFNNIEYISKGLYGSVYRGTWDEYDGVEHAIKVMPANSGKEEARIYKTISDARKDNKSIAKHFPRVDMARYDKQRDLVLIVMEILEDDQNARSVIQDIFGQGEVGRFRPDLSLDDMDVQKNIGKRANLMITDEKTKQMVLDKMLYFVPNRQEEVKRNMMNISFRGVKRQPKVYKTVNKQYKTGSKMFELIDVLMEDLMWKDDGKLMGAEAFSFAIRFIYECMKAWEKDFEEDFRILFEEIEGAIEGFINMYRQWTPVGIVPKGDGFLQGAPPEAQGAGYPGVKSILKAIQQLEATTGLEARDMHDHNILVRPQTKEIVIVDVGMFIQGKNMAKKWRRGQPPRYERDVTAMEEVFPHAGIPTGTQRKQNGEKEHTGHVKRAKHQGRREVMEKFNMKLTNKDLQNITKEELKKFLFETTTDPEQNQKSFMNMRFDTLFETGFDGIFQIIEFAESLGMNMPRVYDYISKKLYDIEITEADGVMEYFDYDYEGLSRLFVNITEAFGDDFFKPKAYRMVGRRFAAIKEELKTINRDHNGNREVDDDSYSTHTTYRQMTSTPQKRAALRGESIIADIAEAFEYYAAKAQDSSAISEKKKRKKAGTESSKESSLRDWFGRKGAKGKKKGWVDCNAPDGKGGYKSCGRSSGEKRKKYPSCRPTPGACKEKGKGKSWGKKAKKRGKKK